MTDDKNLELAIQRSASRDEASIPTVIDEKEPDPEIDLGEHELAYQVQLLGQKIKELQDTHDLRLGYARKIFWLVCVWLLCVVLTTIMSGFRFYGFLLSDAVLMTFMTSTTVSVTGLFLVVAKWMFPNGKAS